MNSILKQIIYSWWLAASFGFPAAVSAQSLTPSQIQQVNSGLFRSNSQDFFQQGYRQLEREIAILLQRNVTSEGKILEIDEKLLSQLCRQEFTISSRNFDTVNTAQIANLKAKLTDICRPN
ncbi:hypothetical protein D0A34_05565 [Microcoleus vaginatus PCC 9802]|uniref:hypothetical protein n=1 Tax=Microcoleus vaginatus TaxID=119532 RepID=UPI00020D2839|nr:hypothetical protein MicvaDRAFT_0757 [Microcoleus vaginatus FGP-2]UNU18412.1 hypothetical protein D0A34_05565 [Microcoleus vaginatus PCC 9802]